MFPGGRTVFRFPFSGKSKMGLGFGIRPVPGLFIDHCSPLPMELLD
jgi:hypothetical protein